MKENGQPTPKQADDGRRRLIANISWLYVVQAVSFLLAQAAVPLLFRTLGPAKFGLLVFAQATTQYFALVTDYGFNITASRDVALLRIRRMGMSETFSAVMASKGILLLASFFAMLALTRSFPPFQTEQAVFELAFLGVIGSSLQPFWLFQGMERLALVSALNIVGRVLALAALLMLIHQPHDYLLALGIQSGAVLLVGAAGLALAVGLFGVRFVPPSPRMVWTTLKEGWHVFASTAAINIYTTTNTVVLGLVSSNQIVGIYGSADRLVKTVQSLSSPLSARQWRGGIRARGRSSII
jgi:PST family polysaccharide transporter